MVREEVGVMALTSNSKFHCTSFLFTAGAFGTHQLRKGAREKWRQSWSKIMDSPEGWPNWANGTMFGQDQKILTK